MITPAQIIARYKLPTALVRQVRSSAHDRAWYSITNAAGAREATVRIYDEIGFWGVTAADLVAELDALDVDTIHLHINSPGGAVWDALAIYHTLLDHPAAVVATVDGYAASGASLILQAGTERRAQAGTRIMIHEASGGTWGTADELRDYADLLDAVTGDIAGIYARHAGGTADDWAAKLHEGDTWYSPSEAIAAGLLDTLTTTTNDAAPDDTEDAATEATNVRRHQPTNTARPKETATMDPETAAALSDLRRDIDIINSTRPIPPIVGAVDTSALFAYTSYGQYVQAMAHKTPEALAAFDAIRAAYTGPAKADTINLPNWLGVLIGDMKAMQPVLGMFDHTYDLPDTGTSVDYGKISARTATVTEQANWGDTLSGGAKVTLTTANATIRTYGGWGETAIQDIERATVGTIDLLWTTLALTYAAALEARGKAQLDSVYTTAYAAPTVTTAKTLANLTAVDWRAIMIDFVSAVYGGLWPITGFAASPTVFKQLASVLEQKTALQVSGNPTDKEGEINLGTLAGTLEGFSVKMVPGWAGDKFCGYYHGAIRVQESAGAPLRLTGELNVTNLVKPVSVYGYAADYAPLPAAVWALKTA